LQLAIALVAGRVVGWLGCKLLGQPQVVGEMIAGFLFGVFMPRGLMILIIINIGLQKGIIGPTLFSMLVVRASFVRWPQRSASCQARRIFPVRTHSRTL
jgi:Kef-type K+ transport system membrane component KefB